jgi:hypothetical protein
MVPQEYDESKKLSSIISKAQILNILKFKTK